VVTASGPGAAVAGGQDGGGLIAGEPVDVGGGGPGSLDRQDPADHVGVVGCVQFGVTEHGVDSGEAVAAGAGAVAAPGLQVLEESGDQHVAGLGDPHLGWRCPGGLLGIGQQQPPGISVRGDRVRAGFLLLHQLDVEETLQDRGQVTHRHLGPVRAGCRRP
jgi:hypothetical protein